MTKATLATTVLAAALASGCATNGTKPEGAEPSLADRASAAWNTTRATVANAIAPSSAASAPATAASAATAKKGPQVIWGDPTAKEKLSQSNTFTLAARAAAAKVTSINGEYIAVKIADSKKDSKYAPVIQYGKIEIESCSPTVAGVASTAAGVVGNRLISAGGQLLGNKISGATGNGLLGGAGNVVQTQSQRAGVANAQDTKAQITSAGALTPEQTVACNKDKAALSTDVKSFVSKLSSEYATANKGSTPVVTYGSSADISSLGLTTARAPR